MGRTGYNCIRYCFCWVNILVLISGGLALGCGIWLRIQHPDQSSPVPHIPLASADVALMALGCLIIATSFFGCCGSWCQSKCLLITYFCVVVILLCGEFVVGSLAYVFREQVGNSIRTQLQKGVELHYNTTDNSLVPMWDRLQTEFQCCGVENYEDWYQISAWPLERRVPDSCCRLTGEGAQDCGKRKDPELWYQEGCFKAIELWLVERLHYVGIVVFIIAFIQLFGLISSMILFCTVQRERYSRTYKSYQPTS